jgi:hypothetical protein
MEWPYLAREQKRQILASVGPEIRAADYVVEGMKIALLGDSNNVSRSRTVVARLA